MLKESGANAAEMELLRSQLEHANGRKQELETETRLSHQKILELSSQLEDIEEAGQKSKEGDSVRLAKKHEEAEKLSVEMERLKQQLTEAEKGNGNKGNQHSFFLPSFLHSVFSRRPN